MNGDLSRITFDPLKHFTRVVLQQGRVQLDADGNEQTAILLHYLRALAADLIGQHGGPDDVYNDVKRTELVSRNCGFAIIAASKPVTGGTASFFPANGLLVDEKTEKALLIKDLGNNNQIALRICTGHYYVDGLLCENEEYRRYSQQPDLRLANERQINELANGAHLLYLDVWERHISALEDPSIREVALGGADTTARTRLTWQVRVGPKLEPQPANCNEFNAAWPEILTKLQRGNRGRLQAKAKEASETDADDVCITSPDSRYRGMENQLYRVEIHHPGPALDATGSNRGTAATFKWSRDNGTIVASLKRKDGDHLIVHGLRDFSRWFTAGNWVEVTHDALELNGKPGTLVRLARVEGETLTIDRSTASGTIYEPGTNFRDMPIQNLKVRRWDQKQPADDLLREGAISIEENIWIELEDGVMIFFEPGTPATQYRSGDYWLIPARVSTGDVEWPYEIVPGAAGDGPHKSPRGLPPNGILHHYAPLAAITMESGHVNDVLDLRHKFPPAGTCGGTALRALPA